MREDSSKRDPGRLDSLEAGLVRDLAALGARSARSVKSLSRTVAGLEAGSVRSNREDRFMSLVSGRKLMLGAAAAVVAIAVFFFPVSYEKVVGHQASLNLSGAGLDREAVMTVAGELERALPTDAVNVGSEAVDGVRTYFLSADVPANAAAASRAVCEAFARSLTEKGYTAEVSISPQKKRVSGNLYAMARDNVIRIEMEGKSDAELETEIVAALASVGVSGAEVSVMSNEDGTTEITIDHTVELGPGDEEPVTHHPEIVLTHGGQPIAGESQSSSVLIREEQSAAGTAMIVSLTEDGQIYEAKILNPETFSDGELAREIHRQLAGRGLDVSVSVQDGEINLLQTDPGARVEEESWGGLKRRRGGQ